MKILEVSHLYKKYNETEVLKDISFNLEQGEVLAIIGSSGSGKTTLLRCLNFLETADQGIIKVNGNIVFDAKNKTKMSESEIRERRLHFGLVFQSFNLFPHHNVLKNVTLAPMLLKKESKEDIYKKAHFWISRVGLSDKELAYPNELSGGQQQRVAIARALVLNPDILCFDEPTSALDPELTTEVLKVIKDLKSENTTMIVVTHEMEFARSVADKIIFMQDGRIEDYGTPEDIFSYSDNEKTKAFLSKSLE